MVNVCCRPPMVPARTPWGDAAGIGSVSLLCARVSWVPPGFGMYDPIHPLRFISWCLVLPFPQQRHLPPLRSRDRFKTSLDHVNREGTHLTRPERNSVLLSPLHTTHMPLILSSFHARTAAMSYGFVSFFLRQPGVRVYQAAARSPCACMSSTLNGTRHLQCRDPCRQFICPHPMILVSATFSWSIVCLLSGGLRYYKCCLLTTLHPW